MNYIESQFYHVSPYPVLEGRNGTFRMKVSSGIGRKTHWFTLTPEQFRAIEILVSEHPAFNESKE